MYKISDDDLQQMALNAQGKIDKIYIHWTAGHYDQLFDHYHMCIDGSGSVHIMDNLDARGQHCYKENTNNFGIATCS